jgi:hypothetical protein
MSTPRCEGRCSVAQLTVRSSSPAPPAPAPATRLRQLPLHRPHLIHRLGLVQLTVLRRVPDAVRVPDVVERIAVQDHVRQFSRLDGPEILIEPDDLRAIDGGGQRLVILKDGRAEQRVQPRRSTGGRRVCSSGASWDRRDEFFPASLLDPSCPGSSGVRPHDVTLTDPGEGNLAATVELVEGTGSEQHVHLRLEGASDARLIAVAPPDQEIRVGERVGLRLRADRMHVFDEL